MYINYNSLAAASANTLNKHYGDLAVSAKRLSSGLRVNGAADDAAGLAIRELMRADIATLKQGIRNANDAVSLVQMADSILDIIDETLFRMKTLALQAASDVYDSTQRLVIESEYQQMASEITRIANATDFNGIKLLDGSLADKNQLKIHFGSGNSSSEDYYYISIGSATASSLGIGNSASSTAVAYTVSTQEAASKALIGIEEAIVSKDKLRAHLGALQNRLENTIASLTIQSENLQTAESRISDVDIATEMTQFVRKQILAHSAAAMLSQSNNSLSQLAMKLIN